MKCFFQITLVEKEQAFARADEPERKKESKKKLQKQKVPGSSYFPIALCPIFTSLPNANGAQLSIIILSISFELKLFQAQASREGGM